MTFALFILYLVLTYINPAEVEPALSPYRLTYWVGIAGLGSAVASLFGSRGRPLANLQLWALIVFTLVMIVSLLVAERWLGAPLLVLQRFGPSLTMFVLAICSVRSLGQLRIAAVGIIVLTTALVLQGAAAYHFGYNREQFLLDRTARTGDPAVTADEPAYFDAIEESPDVITAGDGSPAPARIRALGFMHDPNDLAVAMIVALGLIVGAWQPRRPLHRLVLTVTAGALVYGIYLTRSRGGAVALVVVLWRYAAARLGHIPALGLLLALGAGVVAVDFGGRSLSMDLDESVSGRLVAWVEGLEMLKAQPILGVGYGQFLEYHTLTAHNSLLLALAETGLLGGFFWVGLFVVTFLELRRLETLRSDDAFDDTARQWAEGLYLSLLGFISAAFFLSRTFAPTLYLVVGLAVALTAIARNAGRSIPLPAVPQLVVLVLACELGSLLIVYTMVKLHVA
jgi:putative inorganic carbon (HCO3(-)) transporter